MDPTTGRRLLQTLDAAAFVAVVVCGTLLLGGLAGVVLGGGALLARDVAFVAGLIVLAAATVLTRPKSTVGRVAARERPANSEPNRVSSDPRWIQRQLARAIPGQEPLTPDTRLPLGVRLLVAGAALLAVALGPVVL
ncbi:DUF7555 family protein [Haloferacaceae archaeon DSL9]